MKVSPMPSNVIAPGIEAPLPQRTDVQTIKMKVSRTPEGRFAPIEAEPVENKEEKTDNIDKPNATVEATEPLSPQFAALARERRALQVKAREIADREKAFESKSQGSDQISKAKLKSDPLSVLMEAGVTYDELTQAILANQGSSEVTALKAELNAIKEGIDNKFKEKDTQAEQQVLAEMRREADRTIVSNDDFELVRETRSVPKVMELIEKTYKTTGEVLDVSEALKLVEDELFKRQSKLANTKKLQGLYKPAEVAPMQQRHQGMRTLTNKDTASVPMTARDRALAAFYGTLKK